MCRQRARRQPDPAGSPVVASLVVLVILDEATLGIVVVEAIGDPAALPLAVDIGTLLAEAVDSHVQPRTVLLAGTEGARGFAFPVLFRVRIPPIGDEPEFLSWMRCSRPLWLCWIVALAGRDSSWVRPAAGLAVASAPVPGNISARREPESRTNLPPGIACEPTKSTSVQGRLLQSSTFRRSSWTGVPQSWPPLRTLRVLGRIPANPSVTHSTSHPGFRQRGLDRLPLGAGGPAHSVFHVPMRTVDESRLSVTLLPWRVLIQACRPDRPGFAGLRAVQPRRQAAPRAIRAWPWLRPLSNPSRLLRLDHRQQVLGAGSRDIAVCTGSGAVAAPRGLLDDHYRVRLQSLEALPGRDQHALPLVPLL